MKKLALILGLFAFVAFGVIAVQNVVAATNGVEIVELDNDPTKDNDKAKKDAKTADVKAKDGKSGCCATSCCSGKSSTKMASADTKNKENPDKK